MQALFFAEFHDGASRSGIRTLSSRVLSEAEPLIESCEHCNPDGAEIPFDKTLMYDGLRSERDGTGIRYSRRGTGTLLP